MEGVTECSSSSSGSSKVHKGPDGRHPSPLTILEPSFSNESCISSDSLDSANDAGGKSCCCSSSVQAQHNAGSARKKRPQSEEETDISDSASSHADTVCGGGGHRRAEIVAVAAATADPAEVRRHESEYVRDILRAADVNPDALTLCPPHHALDPLLFDQLESKSKRFRAKGSSQGYSGQWRRLLFDCVGECLESRRGRHFQAGYRSWAKGAAAATAVAGGRAGALADEVFREISDWRGMGDWMVDELVDKDMSSSSLGRWVDFEVEAFEAGVEVEEEILGSLVDEMVADFL